MNTTIKERPLMTWLFNPFIYIAGGRSLLLGIVAILLAGFLGIFSRTHFNGVLDMHTGKSSPLWVFLSEGLIAWLLLGIVLLVFGKIISKTSFRSLDLLGTQAMARWPTIISVLIMLPTFSQDANGRFGANLMSSITNQSSVVPLSPADVVIFIFTTLVALLMVCWFVVLAYRSYAVSCNVKGGKAIGTFIAGILIAEILSIIVMPIFFVAMSRMIHVLERFLISK
jgi:hypothetical protein